MKLTVRQALLLKVEQYYQELQKRYDKEETDYIRYQDELGKAQKKATDLAKTYQGGQGSA